MLFPLPVSLLGEKEPRDEGYLPTHHGTREVYPGCTCLSPSLIYEGYSRVMRLLPCVVVTMVQYVHTRVGNVALLTPRLEKRGLCARESLLFHLRIFSSSQGKPSQKGQQSRYRKHP